MVDRIFNVPVVTNDQGAESRIVGVADVNYETGEVQMNLGTDVTAVMQGSFGEQLHYIGLYLSGGNASDQPIELRHSAWTNVLERKEVFERVNKEEKTDD